MDLGYTGKPYDAVTGLYDYGYRDYKAEVARFTSIDPIRDGSNWYAYVNNDPVNWVDPWGLECSASDRGSTQGNTGSESENVFEMLKTLGKEFLEIFTVDLKVGLGFGVSVISDIKVDLVSMQGRFSGKNGFEEQWTTGISSWIVGYTKTAPKTEGISAIDAFRLYGKNEGNIGPYVFGDDGSDIQLNFGAQAIVGFNISLSGKEILDFILKIGEVQHELER
jgi:RHS repeat-associated protein